MVAAWFGVHRSTIRRSIAEILPLLAEWLPGTQRRQARHALRRRGLPRAPPAGVDRHHL
ncbi:hypothetical protein [Micromonospora rubida]